MTSISAHEFWLTPSTFQAKRGAQINLHLRVGQNFEGDAVAFDQSVVSSLKVRDTHHEVDVTQQLPQTTQRDGVTLKLQSSGPTVIALDSHPFTLELSADRFNDYLRDEGLDHVLAQREARNESTKPGRERYRRNVKTVLGWQGKAPEIVSTPTEQTLEIIPIHLLTDTAAQKSKLSLKVQFQKLPLQNALVKAWHTEGAQLTILRTRTNTQGHTEFTLPFPGVWMISLVHMVPATDNADIDWDSYWGNLTIQVPSPKN